MSVRANWFLAELELPDVDAAAQIAGLQSAPVLDLSGPGPLASAALAAEFAALVQREANYSKMFGHECDLKWTVESAEGARNPCRSCPLYCHDTGDPDSLLCKLGIEQENALDAFLGATGAEVLDRDMLRLVEGRFDAAQELAEALLA